jgi:hypothetical protein
MRRLLGVLGVVTLVAAAACGSRGEDAAPTSPSPAAPAGPQESTEDKLPDNFPEDFPLPEEYTVLYASVPSDQTGIVFFRTEESTEDVARFMAAELPKAGWTLSYCLAPVETPRPLRLIQAVKDKLTVTATIGEQPSVVKKFEGDYSFWVSYVTGAAAPEPSAPVDCPQ